MNWSDFAYIWLPWIGLVVYFAAFETRAVRDHRPGGTLTETIWRILGIREQPSGWVQARRIGFAALWLVLTIHLFVPSFIPL